MSFYHKAPNGYPTHFLEDAKSGNNAIYAYLRIDPNIILRIFLKGDGKAVKDSMQYLGHCLISNPS